MPMIQKSSAPLPLPMPKPAISPKPWLPQNRPWPWLRPNLVRPCSKNYNPRPFFIKAIVLVGLSATDQPIQFMNKFCTQFLLILVLVAILAVELALYRAKRTQQGSEQPSLTPTELRCDHLKNPA